MKIKSLKYINEDKSLVIVNEKTVIDPSTRNRFTDDIKKWLEENDNKIHPFKSVDELKNEEILKLKNNCKLNIESGFYSEATGTKYLYESELKDQINLSNLVNSCLRSFYYPCVESNGNKILVKHSSKEIKKVLTDFMRFAEKEKTKLYKEIENLN